MSYTGRMIESLIETVEKIQTQTPKQNSEPKGTPMLTDVEDFVEAERNGRDGRAA